MQSSSPVILFSGSINFVLLLYLLVFYFIKLYQSYLSKMDLNTPLSINVANIFFKTINKIGPIIIPNTPMNLNPVYIAINVKIG